MHIYVSKWAMPVEVTRAAVLMYFMSVKRTVENNEAINEIQAIQCNMILALESIEAEDCNRNWHIDGQSVSRLSMRKLTSEEWQR